MEPIKLRYAIIGGNLTAAGNASSQMKLTLKKLGLPQETIRRASICMYEGEINMVIHAEGGEAQVEIGLDEIVIRLIDRGPGIADIDKAMEAGWSTATGSIREMGFGAGMGLPNMKSNSDEMRIDTRLGEGTTVTMTIRVA